jgi:hypothetical protein
MKNYISVFENVLEPHFCKQLIDKFERATDAQVVRNDKYKAFKEINFAQHPMFAEEQQQILTSVQPFIQKYLQFWNIKFFPNELGFEQVRMKRYETGVWIVGQSFRAVETCRIRSVCHRHPPMNNLNHLRLLLGTLQFLHRPRIEFGHERAPYAIAIVVVVVGPL